MSKFNFFKILEKDNKELIHSAFISFLIDTNENFKYKFLGLEPDSYGTSVLEKTYTEKKKTKNKLRTRIDIEISSLDGKSFVFIENKFKSFPNQMQLENYDRVFKSNFTKDVKLKKILFCFDKKLVFFDTAWEIFDYQDLVQFLDNEFDFSKSGDETLFISHYYAFLCDYLADYEKYKADCSPLFKKNTSNDEKFWLRLLNSQLQLSFSKIHGNMDFTFVSNPGNTSTPLLNIIPAKWEMVTALHLLLQFQGNDIKFYIHSTDRDAIQGMINFCTEKIWDDQIELKKLSNRKSKSCFILKIKVRQMLGTHFSIEEIFNLINAFYKNLDKNIIEEYSAPVIEQ